MLSAAVAVAVTPLPPSDAETVKKSPPTSLAAGQPPPSSRTSADDRRPLTTSSADAFPTPPQGLLGVEELRSQIGAGFLCGFESSNYSFLFFAMMRPVRSVVVAFLIVPEQVRPFPRRPCRFTFFEIRITLHEKTLGASGDAEMSHEFEICCKLQCNQVARPATRVPALMPPHLSVCGAGEYVASSHQARRPCTPRE